MNTSVPATDVMVSSQKQFIAEPLPYLRAVEEKNWTGMIDNDIRPQIRPDPIIP